MQVEIPRRQSNGMPGEQRCMALTASRPIGQTGRRNAIDAPAMGTDDMACLIHKSPGTTLNRTKRPTRSGSYSLTMSRIGTSNSYYFMTAFGATRNAAGCGRGHNHHAGQRHGLSKGQLCTSSVPASTSINALHIAANTVRLGDDDLLDGILKNVFMLFRDANSATPAYSWLVQRLADLGIA
jgi:hypothetical protein